MEFAKELPSSRDGGSEVKSSSGSAVIYFTLFRLFAPIEQNQREALAVRREKKEAKVSAKKEKIRILIADDHPVVRKGLQSCLAKQDKLKVVGEASDGDEALKKTRELVPDVVLMDISMPRMNGLAGTELIRKEAPQVR